MKMILSHELQLIFIFTTSKVMPFAGSPLLGGYHSILQDKYCLQYD
ncbi:hypothetical protein [Chryseobacterium pennipullorum]|nr:hypothetical protein [Chryseobacterium pennipullorum]